MVHKPCRVVLVFQAAMQKHHVPENLPGTTDRGLHQDAGFHVFPEDSHQPLPELYMDPPLPSGPAPIISMAEAACFSFNCRSDFLRLLLLPWAFEAMVMVGRQPFWVWKGFPDS